MESIRLGKFLKDTVQKLSTVKERGDISTEKIYYELNERLNTGFVLCEKKDVEHDLLEILCHLENDLVDVTKIHHSALKTVHFILDHQLCESYTKFGSLCDNLIKGLEHFALIKDESMILEIFEILILFGDEVFINSVSNSEQLLKNVFKSIIEETMKNENLFKAAFQFLNHFWKFKDLSDFHSLIFVEDFHLKIIPALFTSKGEMHKNLIVLTEKLEKQYTYEMHITSSSWEQFLQHISTKYVTQLTTWLLKGDERWASNWCCIIRILNREIYRVANSIINSLLSVVESGFKSSDFGTRTRAFQCWRVLVNAFSINVTELCNLKRIRLLSIPLRAKNCKTVKMGVCKFNTWWELICHMGPKIVDFSDLILIPFLNFCFGPLGDTPLLSHSEGPGSMAAITAEGKKFIEVSVLAVDALLQMLGHSNAECDCICNTDKKLKKPLITNEIFVKNSKQIIYSVGECCVMLLNWEYDPSKIVNCLWDSILNHITSNTSEDIQQRTLSELMSIFIAFVEVVETIIVKHNFILSVLLDKLLRLSTVKKSIYQEVVIKPIKKRKFILADLFLKQIAEITVIEDKKTEKQKIKPTDINVWIFLAEFLCICETLTCNKEDEVILKNVLKWPLSIISKVNNETRVEIEEALNQLYRVILKDVHKSNGIFCEMCEYYRQQLENNPSLISHIRTVIFNITQSVNTNGFESDALHSLVIEIAKYGYSVTKILQSLLQMYFMTADLPKIYKFYSVISTILDKYEASYILEKQSELIEVNKFFENIIEQAPPKTLADSSFLNLLKKYVSVYGQIHLQNYSSNIEAELKLRIVSLPKSVKSKIDKHLKWNTDIQNESILVNENLKATPDCNTKKQSQIRNKNDNTSPNSCHKKVSKNPRIQKMSEIISNSQILSHDVNAMKATRLLNSSSNIRSVNTKQVNDIMSPQIHKSSAKTITHKTNEKDDVVFIQSTVWKPDLDKLTERQKERTMRRREDIPALYQDLSQTNSQDVFNTSKQKECSINLAKNTEVTENNSTEKNTHNSTNFSGIIETKIRTSDTSQNQDKRTIESLEDDILKKTQMMKDDNIEYDTSERMCILSPTLGDKDVDSNAVASETSNNSLKMIIVRVAPIKNTDNSVSALQENNVNTAVHTAENEYSSIKKHSSVDIGNSQESENIQRPSTPTSVCSDFSDQSSISGRSRKKSKHERELERLKIDCVSFKKHSSVDIDNSEETDNIQRPSTPTSVCSDFSDHSSISGRSRKKSKHERELERLKIDCVSFKKHSSVDIDNSEETDNIQRPSTPTSVCSDFSDQSSISGRSRRKSKRERELERLKIDCVQSNEIIITKRKARTPHNKCSKVSPSQKSPKENKLNSEHTCDNKNNDFDKLSCSEDIIESSQDSALSIVFNKPLKLDKNIEKKSVTTNSAEIDKNDLNVESESQLTKQNEIKSPKNDECTKHSSDTNIESQDGDSVYKTLKNAISGALSPIEMDNSLVKNDSITKQVNTCEMNTESISVDFCDSYSENISPDILCSVLNTSKDKSFIKLTDLNNSILAASVSPSKDEEAHDERFTEFLNNTSNISPIPKEKNRTILEEKQTNDILKNKIANLAYSKNIVDIAYKSPEMLFSEDIDEEIKKQEPIKTYSSTSPSLISAFPTCDEKNCDSQMSDQLANSSSNVSEPPSKKVAMEDESKSANIKKETKETDKSLAENIISATKLTDSFDTEVKSCQETSLVISLIDSPDLMNAPPTTDVVKKRITPKLVGRSAQLLGLVPGAKQIEAQTACNQPTIQHSSPKRSTRRKLLMGKLKKSGMAQLKINSNKDASSTPVSKESNLLKFERALPSPLAKPSSSIIKTCKRTHDQVEPDDTGSPSRKKKRVSFQDPPISSMKEYINENVNRKKCSQLMLQKSTPLLKLDVSYLKNEKLHLLTDSKVFDKEVTCKSFENENTESVKDSEQVGNRQSDESICSQNIILNITNEDATDTSDETQGSVEMVQCEFLSTNGPFFPRLLTCKENIASIITRLISPMWQESLSNIFKDKKICTVGDFASLSEAEVNRLPINGINKVQFARHILETFANDLITTNIILDTNTEIDKESRNINCEILKDICNVVLNNENMNEDVNMEGSDASLSLEKRDIISDNDKIQILDNKELEKSAVPENLLDTHKEIEIMESQQFIIDINQSCDTNKPVQEINFISEINSVDKVIDQHTESEKQADIAVDKSNLTRDEKSSEASLNNYKTITTSDILSKMVFRSNRRRRSSPAALQHTFDEKTQSAKFFSDENNIREILSQIFDECKEHDKILSLIEFIVDIVGLDLILKNKNLHILHLKNHMTWDQIIADILSEIGLDEIMTILSKIKSVSTNKMASTLLEQILPKIDEGIVYEHLNTENLIAYIFEKCTPDSIAKIIPESHINHLRELFNLNQESAADSSKYLKFVPHQKLIESLQERDLPPDSIKDLIQLVTNKITMQSNLPPEFQVFGSTCKFFLELTKKT